MSYFLVCCLLFKYKLEQMHYLGLEILLSIARIFVVSVRRSFSSSGCVRKAALCFVALPRPSI